MVREIKDQFDKVLAKELTLETQETLKYWIAGDHKDVVHYGVLNEGQRLTTGQPYLETYNDKQIWIEALAALGVVYEEPEFTKQ